MRASPAPVVLRMPPAPPDPAGRPSSAKHAPADAAAPAETGEAIAERPGSTGSHHPGPAGPIADIVRQSGPSRMAAAGSDILQMLGPPGASPVVSAGSAANAVPDNTDDSPTVITRGLPPAVPSASRSLPVIGDPPAVAGRRLGHFELIEAIGAGGMAAVLKARDLDLGRIVALKILPPEAAHDVESVTRFRQEARAAAMLDHENIARVYFCGEDQGLHFIAFELVEGENLRVLIDRRGTIPAGECVRYMIQIAAGLNHAAERGVVHRDIKPSNLIVTPDGRAKIVDMGLARHLDSLAVNGGVTQSGVTLGTFDYISPEQALDPRRADVRSDIYSLGCAFYHALTGRPPVPEGTAAKKLHAHQHVDPLDPRVLNPAVPDALAAVLSRMMAKTPERRYQTPADLIVHLKGLAEAMRLPLAGVASDSAVRALPADGRVLPEMPRLRLGWVVAAAAVAAAVALSTGGGGPPPPPPWPDQPEKPFDPLAGLTPDKNPNPGPAAEPGVVRTAKELADALAAGKPKIQLGPGTFDLTRLPDAVAFAGGDLLMEGSPRGSTVVLAAAHARQSPGTLTVKAGSVAIRGLRFELVSDAGSWDLLATANPAGLLIQSATRVELTDCAFVSQVSADDEAAAVEIAPPAEGTRVVVRVARCAFGHARDAFRDGVALLVPARADVAIEDSGFGPHAAAIRVETEEQGDGPPAGPTKVSLYRSSFMLDAGCAAVATAGLAEVSAGYCAFAPVGTVRSPLPFVLADTSDGQAQLTGVKGQKNVYYGINPATDREAVILTRRPWTDPRPLDTLAGSDPWRAFGLDPSERRLALAERDIAIVGAQFHLAGSNIWRAYPPTMPWPPDNLPKASATEARELVWHPDAKDDPLPANTYTDLRKLVADLRTGDVVLIRHDGLLPVGKKGVDLEKPRGGNGEFKVTFRASPGYRPILTADPEGTALDQSLFRLLGGEVAFEGVQFLLRPTRPKNLQRVAAVAVVAGVGCTFIDCVFTLAEEDDATAAAVVIDPDKVMAMAGVVRAVPEVKFDRCVIRGRGRGVWVPVSRTVHVGLTQTLAALDGPLFLAEPAGKSPAGGRSSLTLTRVTAFAGGPIVAMRGGQVGAMRGTGLVPLDVHADECLFAAVPGAGRPLVELDGIDQADANVLTWRVTRANRYANFDAAAAVMIVRPAGEGTTPKEWTAGQWVDFAGEAGKPVGNVMFERGPAGLRDLAALAPADAVVKDVDFRDVAGAKAADAGVGADVLPKLPALGGDEPVPE